MSNPLYLPFAATQDLEELARRVDVKSPVFWDGARYVIHLGDLAVMAERLIEVVPQRPVPLASEQLSFDLD